MAKVLITLTIDLNEVAYSVYNDTYLVGKSRDTGENARQVANIQDSSTDEALGKIERSVSSALNEVRMMLSEYLVDNGLSVNNERQEIKGSVVLQFRAPYFYADAARMALGSAVHKYLSYCAIADWLAITHPSDATVYVKQAQAQMGIIVSALNKRRRPTRDEINVVSEDLTIDSRPENTKLKKIGSEAESPKISKLKKGANTLLGQDPEPNNQQADETDERSSNTEQS